WDHLLSRLRADRAETQTRTSLTERLTAQGIRVLDRAHLPARTVRLDLLADTAARPPDPDSHATCPGHAVTLGNWQPERTVAYCIEPDSHGHTDRYPTRRTATATP